MTAVAARRAAAAGLNDVSARDLDLEDVAEPDAAYDVVCGREGLTSASTCGATGKSSACRVPAGACGTASGARASATRGSRSCFDAVGVELGRAMPPPASRGRSR